LQYVKAGGYNTVERKGDTVTAIVPFKWKLKGILDKHGITPYRLMKESGISQTTIYGIAGGRHATLNGQVLDRIMDALGKLTGKTFSIADIVEWERDNG
jgi:predicted transcriptional regulator